MKISEIETAIRQRTPRKIILGPNTLVAAVAMILREQGKGVETLLIKRVDRAGDPWSGQVAFPGGKRAGDESLMETAIRETKEEVGIDLQHQGRILGELDDVRGHIDAVVTPFVGAVNSKVGIVSNAEVASYGWIPFDKLRRYVYAEVPKYGGGTSRRRAYRVDDFLIWGMTFRILGRAIKLADIASGLRR